MVKARDLMKTASMRIGRLSWLAVFVFFQSDLSAGQTAEYYYSDNQDDGVTIDWYIGSGDAVAVPSELGGKPVTRIGMYAFSNCTGIRFVWIPYGVVSIECQAFKGCTGLINIDLPESILVIENGAFENCTGLTTIVLPDGVTVLDKACFAGCTGLAQVTLSEQVKSIDNACFEGCTALQTIYFKWGDLTFGSDLCANLPGGITNIGYDAFNGCVGLTEVKVDYDTRGEGALTIHQDAFTACCGLASVTIGCDVETVDTQTFLCCSNLNSVVFLGDVGEIRACAFTDFLKAVTIHGDVGVIGKGAFFGHGSDAARPFLKEISVYGNIDRIDEEAFYFAYDLKDVTFRSHVFSIGSRAFGHCTNLTSVSFISGVSCITTGVFDNCSSLRDVEIPEGVSTIRTEAFGGCAGLINVTFPGSLTLVEERAFVGCPFLSATLFRGFPPRVEGDGLLDLDDLATIYHLPSSAGWEDAFAGSPAEPWSGDIIVQFVSDITVGRTESDPAPIIVTKGQPYGALPTPASPVTGFGFAGWRTGFSRGEEVTSTAIVNLSVGQTLIANWTNQTDMSAYFDYKVAFFQVTITGYHGPAGEATIPLIIEGLPVTAVGARAFSGCVGLTRLTVPASVWSIGDYAFEGCSGLTGVYFEANPPAIGTDIFLGSEGVTVYYRSYAIGWGETFGGRPTALWDGTQPSESETVMVGMAFQTTLDEPFASAEKVTVKGLPAGLKYDAGSRTITGIPTKAGTYEVILSAPGLSSQTLTLLVDVLPDWAYGTFDGFVSGGGSATLAISSVGKITGKISFGGTNYTFKAASYASGDKTGGLVVTATAKAGKASLSLDVTVSAATNGIAAALGIAEGKIGNEVSVTAYRNVWKDPGMQEVALSFAGYYTLTLSGDVDFGSGYLTTTTDKAGKVKTAGKLSDGTRIAQGGTLMVDADGRLFAVFYVAPKAYKGGCLFGSAEFVTPDTGAVFLRPVAGVPFLWCSLDSQATEHYGEGFERRPALSGGWYSKTENLYGYYQAMTLSAGTDANAVSPELAVKTNRYVSACWGPSGVTVVPLVNASGVMTGLSVPPAGKPTDSDGDGVWDYSAENVTGVKISLAGATGVFKGSFLAWFDYSPEKHFSKKLSFEGALTPVREILADGVEGRGYFLWADKAVQPLTGKSYPFNWSYDFRLFSEPAQ